ncbi:MAG: CHAT domain-containing protein [Chitinophagaceae bacterium]|nr:CHAT domain-containing protein [Chitinophagaceae bacterium]
MKKIAAAFILTFLFIPAIAQSWEEMNKELFVLNQQGEFKKAIVVAEKLLKESLNNPVGKDHPNYVMSLYNLAVLYTKVGRYEEAEPFFKEVRVKVRIYLGEKSFDYAATTEGLAELYIGTGDYIKAEQIILDAKNTLQELNAENTTNYAVFLNLLANLYTEKGRYGEAEKLYIRVKDIRKELLGDSSQPYAISLTNLAGLYLAIGQYTKSEELYTKAESIMRNSVGIFHPDYSTCINNMSSLYSRMGQFIVAENLLLTAIKISEKTTSENDASYATKLNNLGELYRETGRLRDAELALIRAEEIDRETIGENHPGYARTLNNLAFLYSQMDQYQKAESLYIRANNIRRSILGADHPEYAEGLDNLAGLYLKKKEYEKSEPLLIESGQSMIQGVRKTLGTLSEKEKNNFLKWGYENSASKPSSLILFRSQKNPELVKSSYDQQLFFKSLSLYETRTVFESIYNSTDSITKSLLGEWQKKKKALAGLYSKPDTGQVTARHYLESETEELEKQLSVRSTAFRDQQNSLAISFRDIQKKLQPDEAAIEFTFFNLYDKDLTDSVIYAAYLLKANDPSPAFIPLCTEKQIRDFFKNTSTSAAGIKSVYRSEILDEDNFMALPGDSLFALAWKPLEPYLKGIKKISYSPAGLLNRIAFHALPAGNGQLLIDKYALNSYISTRQLTIPGKTKEVSKNSIALFGDPAFTMDSLAMTRNPNESVDASTIYSAEFARNGDKKVWKNLNGTAKEVNDIKSLFERNQVDTLVYTQINATEEKLKSLSGHSPTILHLATHGFFLPDQLQKKKEGFSTEARNAFAMSDDPMLRSGVVLAGANRVWSGRPPVEGREDGIVTAYEISQMDLGNTDLVVLSACETALGDIQGTEGVFGLQRAFKLAGVKSMLLSLWKVPDAETAELMTSFYKYYLQDKTARQALILAQREMRKKYSPYYWAAFVVIE